MLCSAATVGLYPLWEGRATMARTFKSIYLDITGKKKFGVIQHEAELIEDNGSASPAEKVAELPNKVE
jgi:hypothetical protein